VWAATHGGVEAFAPLSKHLSKERSRVVLETLLANFWRLEDAPWQAEVSRFAESEDVFLRRAAAYSLSRTGADSARPAQRRLAADAEPVIRATALRGFERGDLARPDIEAVERALGDPDWRVRTAACRVLALQKGLELGPAAIKAVANDFASTQPHLAVSAVAAAGRQPAIGSTAELLAIADSEQSWLAAEALLAVARRRPQAAVPTARAWIESNELWRRRGVARAAVELGEDFERRAASDPEPAVRLAWLETLGEDQTLARRERLLELVASDPDPAVRAQTLVLLRAVDAAPDVEDLIGFYASWKNDRMPDARAEALIAATAATEGTEERAAILALGLTDPNPAVAAMVVNGARDLGLEIVLPGREPRHGTRWYEELTSWVAEPRELEIVTDRGTIRVRLDLETAPVTTREISELATDGFYDGLTFHRVVPNFVVQGGDPRGDGWGGPGFVLPDEPSLRPFDSWRVGIATSGPETGGSQLFFTLLPADHLTGHYTNLGEVVAGQEVLTSIQVGDHIRSIRTVSAVTKPTPVEGAPQEAKPEGQARRVGSAVD
jgi:cyclophilin family peptidyl-prolyl cis-trans isomerase/HEAT repeat protein